MSTWCSRRRCITSITSSSVSPSPSINPDLVGTAGTRCLKFSSKSSDHSKSEPGRAALYRRGTVSRLWLKTSGGSCAVIARATSMRPR
ncbi:hypothetical protein D3C80_1571030 [compost metagenome]